MSFTSINILNKDHNFKYIIEYIDNKEYINNIYSYNINGENIDFYGDDGGWRKNNSILESVENAGVRDYIPEKINLSSVNLYFPEYSLEKYERGVKYVLTVNTWINNNIIYLGTYLLDRSNSDAVDTVKTFYNNKYYEVINVKFIDPWFLNYSDDWKDWRVNICDSKTYGENHELNNNGSIINFTLHPVLKIDDEYVLSDNYTGGQNSINLIDNNINNLKYRICTEYTKYGICFDGNVQFNKAYKQDINGLKEYLSETYGIEDFTTTFEFYIQDNVNLYDYFVIEDQNIRCRLNKKDINHSQTDTLKYTSWDEYVDGMYINSTFNIIDNNGDVLMTIMSNDIPITQEVYKYFIFSGYNDNLGLLKLNLIDMNVYEVNTVNKIVKNIIQLDRPKDYKSNITKPVYYRVRELSHLVVHPAITENICLNLDKYKYLVDTFILRIEGVNFVEISRNSNGVVFKVIGNSLPNTIQSGTYYILNQDNELVSTGKYTYEI